MYRTTKIVYLVVLSVILFYTLWAHNHSKDSNGMRCKTEVLMGRNLDDNVKGEVDTARVMLFLAYQSCYPVNCDYILV